MRADSKVDRVWAGSADNSQQLMASGQGDPRDWAAFVMELDRDGVSA